MAASSPLQYKTYRLFLLAQSMSGMGTMIQFVAVSWLAYTLTDSIFLLSVVSFAKQISGISVSFFSGVIADRVNRKILLRWSHFLIGCLGVLLAYLVFSDTITIYLLFGVQVIIGIIKAMEYPSRQSFVNDIILDKANLSKAIALNSTVINTARLVGPTIAGFIIPIAGIASCLIIYAFFSFAIVVLYQFIDVPKQKSNYSNIKFKAEFVAGFKYAMGHDAIRLLLQFILLFTFFGTSFIVLFPVIADQVFDGGTVLLGYMNSAQGLGAIIGGLIIASRIPASKMFALVGLSAFIFSVAMGIISLSAVVYATLIGVVLSGIGRIAAFTSTNTLLQLMSEDSKRGRILSLYVTMFKIGMTVGGISLGALADYIGLQLTLQIQAVACILICVFYYSKVKLVGTEVALKGY